MRSHTIRQAGGTRRACALGPALAALALTACGDLADPVPRATGPARASAAGQPAWVLAADAARERERAQAGVRRRGEQDEMLKLEARLPGFGGFFIDSLGQVVLYVKPSAQGAPSADAARAAVHEAYRGRAQAIVREIMAPASRAEVRDALYSLSELVAVEQRIATSPVRISGYTGVGVSLFLNRVKVGFKREEDLAPGMEAIAAAGVPLDAIIPEVWGVARPTSNWDSIHRPIRGGIRQVIRNEINPNIYAPGSVGYNVRYGSGQVGFLISAHQPNEINRANGRTGDLIHQPHPGKGTIGTVTVNPNWQEGAECGINPSTGQNYDFCTFADVALASPSVPVDFRIGTSVTEGHNGAAGSQAINNWYPIEATQSAEFVQLGRNVVHKSGQQTGTTTGFIDIPCTDMATDVGINDLWWGAGYKSLRLMCHTRVARAGWGWQDSGAPVFARLEAGGPYYALGIQVAGVGSIDGSGVCNAGIFCSFIFAQWNSIENHLPLGTLDPSTP